MRFFFSLSFASLLTLCSSAQTITTFAGDGSFGFGGDGGAATAAQLGTPNYVVADASRNIYISDSRNQRIRMVSAAGIITTIAGDGTPGYTGDGGPATAAQIYYPACLALSPSGELYFSGPNVVRKVNSAGIISTVAGTIAGGFSGDGGYATAAKLSNPTGLIFDRNGNLLIADTRNHRIRKVDTSGIITTIAGNGTPTYSGDGGAATAASFYYPQVLAIDSTGNIFVSDVGNYRVRKINPAGIITTFAGNGAATFSGDGGSATAAGFNYPTGIAIGPDGYLYIGDFYNARVRKVSPAGIISTFAGNGTAGYGGDGGPATAAQIDGPGGLAINAGTLFIADVHNDRARSVILCSNPVPTPVTGDTVVCLGHSITLHDTVAGGAWTSGNVAIATVNAATGVVTGIGAGTVMITYTMSNACGSTPVFYTLSVDGAAGCASLTSILQPVYGSLQVYPNPNYGSFSIGLPSFLIGEAQVAITNTLGQVVKQYTAPANKELEVKLNSPAGVYFVEVLINGERFTQKVTVLQ